MSLTRIQKWLLSECSNFQDIVLIESPFAETSRGGKGIHQIHLCECRFKNIVYIQSLKCSWNLGHHILNLFILLSIQIMSFHVHYVSGKCPELKVSFCIVFKTAVSSRNIDYKFKCISLLCVVMLNV